MRGLEDQKSEIRDRRREAVSHSPLIEDCSLLTVDRRLLFVNHKMHTLTLDR